MTRIPTRYHNVKANPNFATRTVSFRVNDGLADSNEVTRDVLVLPADILYVGDQRAAAGQDGDTVQLFDAMAGVPFGTSGAGNSGLRGPRGLVAQNGKTLLVANQNVNLPQPGEIDRYDSRTGAFLGALVSALDLNQNANPHAPYAPRGMVLEDNTLYVADYEAGDPGWPGAPTPSGRIRRYDASSGAFLGDLTASGYGGAFHPRGIVFGPDGQLYVSLFDPDTDANGAPRNLGYGAILRINPVSGASSVVAFNNGDAVADPGEAADLHRPEGLVFGPDGRLYVTSFRANADDSDRIVVLDPATGTERDALLLDAPGQPRAYAQALLFGPQDRLFVPITGDGPDTGAVRSYDVAVKTFSVFAPPVAGGGQLATPWYLFFGQTDPATLAYRPWHNFANPVDVDQQGKPTALGVLYIINYINAHPNSKTLPAWPTVPGPYYDVDGDNYVTASDVLNVINAINRGPLGAAEGEAPAVATAAPAMMSPLAGGGVAPGPFFLPLAGPPPRSAVDSPDPWPTASAPPAVTLLPAPPGTSVAGAGNGGADSFAGIERNLDRALLDVLPELFPELLSGWRAI